MSHPTFRTGLVQWRGAYKSPGVQLWPKSMIWRRMSKGDVFGYLTDRFVVWDQQTSKYRFHADAVNKRQGACVQDNVISILGYRDRLKSTKINGEVLKL